MYDGMNYHGRDVFLVSFIRAMEFKLCDVNTKKRIINSPSKEVVFDEIKKTLFGQFLPVNPDQFENELFEEESMTWIYKIIDDYSKNIKLKLYLKSEYDCLNFKNLLKKNILKLESTAVSPLGSIDLDSVTLIFSEEKYSALPMEFSMAVAESINEYYTREEISVVDFFMDKALYEYRSVLLKEINNDFIMKYHLAEIDMKNILSSLRLKGYNIDDLILENIFLPEGSLNFEMFLRLSHGENREFLTGLVPEELINSIGNNDDVLNIEYQLLKNLNSKLKESNFQITGAGPVFTFIKKFKNDVKSLIYVLSVLDEKNSGKSINVNIEEAWSVL